MLQYLTPSLKSLADRQLYRYQYLLYSTYSTIIHARTMQYCTVRVLYYISTIATSSSTSTVLVYLADTYSEQLRADPTPSSKTLASAPDIDKWVSSWN